MRLPEYAHLPENEELKALGELERWATELNKIRDAAGTLSINSATRGYGAGICTRVRELQNVSFSLLRKQLFNIFTTPAGKTPLLARQCSAHALAAVRARAVAFSRSRRLRVN